MLTYQRLLPILQFEYAPSPEWQEVIVDVELDRPPKLGTHRGLFPIDLAWIEAGLGCGTLFEPSEGAHEILARPPKEPVANSHWQIRVRSVSVELMARLALRAMTTFDVPEPVRKVSVVGTALGARAGIEQVDHVLRTDAYALYAKALPFTLERDEVFSDWMSLQIELAGGVFDDSLRERLEFHLGAALNFCLTLSDGLGNPGYADVMPEMSYAAHECTASVNPLVIARVPVANAFLNALVSFHQRHAAIARVSLQF